MSMSPSLDKPHARAAISDIRARSRVLRGLFFLSSIALSGVMVGKHIVWPVVRIVGGARDGETFDGVRADVAANLIGALPAFLLLIAILMAYRLCERMADGDIFSRGNAVVFEWIGSCVIASGTFAALIAPSLINWVRGAPAFDIGFDDWALGLVPLGLSLLLVGRVLALATRIKTESDEIV